ncbi:hypothetical protein U6G28_02550 [Actinomycetaceae bacterium MB13-C1-2]|nr:hypothetical protein U6G28_02550 [Actinomycetaceae bacterium MB13-C1-2]
MPEHMNPEQRICPITGEPLPPADNKAVISRKAADDFKNACLGIARLMEQGQQALTPSRGSSEGGRPRPGSKPPLNLHALSVLSEAQAIIELWAADILQNQYPGASFVPGDWATVQQIYQHADLVHFYPSPDMIPEVDHQIRRLKSLTEPRQVDTRLTELERLAKLDRLKTSWLTIDNACKAVTLYTGRPLAKRTVYNWIDAGKLTSDGHPARINMAELLALHDGSN